MDLSLTDEQKMLKATAAEFVKNETPPRLITDMSKQNIAFDASLRDKAAAMGWMGLALPEEYGGAGASLTDAAMVFEELGRGPIPGPFFSSGVLAALTILEGGSAAQKQQLLPALAQGAHIVTHAILDPSPRFGPEAVSLPAARRNGDFVLNGTKLFVHDAAAADQFICAARTGPGSGPDGISLFLVDAKNSGVSIRPLRGFVASVGEVRFADVRVPASAVLGEIHGGWPVLERAMEQAIPLLCAYQVGGCQQVFEMTVEYTRTRVVFGQTIGRFQRVQDHVVELANHLDAARWTTYEALWKLDTGRDATGSVHLAKAVASDGYYQACNYAFMVFAGVGTDRNHPMVPHGIMSRTLYQYLGDPLYHKRIMADAVAL